MSIISQILKCLQAAYLKIEKGVQCKLHQTKCNLVLAILILDKVCFRTRNIDTDNEQQVIMIRELILQKDLIFKSVHLTTELQNT